MATTPRRPLSNTSSTTTRSSMASPNGLARPLTSTPPSTGHGLARNPSLRGRALRKAPTRSYVESEQELDETERASANAQLMADLKEQVERAELASEQYRTQLDILQLRLDESTDQQIAGEERDFAARTQIDKLLAEARENARLRREMENTIESERNMFLQEKDKSSLRESDLQSRVHRLSGSLQTISIERASTARLNNTSDEDLQPTTQNTNHDEILHALADRDATIDVLRLELADMHIRVAEKEHMGDGRLQILEQQISDIKMQNARLVEENDSFQMLLGEKTMKGDFLHDSHSETAGISSLADELESVGEDDEVSVEQYRKVEAELKNLREEKKALTLYIDKIIGRIMQHDGFEHIITGKDADAVLPAVPAKVGTKEKPLPLAPSAQLSSTASPGPETPTMMGGFLQRAKSVVARNAPARPTRPISYIQSVPTANENPNTAPSVPINRGHRRARSDQMQPIPDLSAQTIAQQSTKASPLRTASGSPMNAGISPLQRSQTSYFAAPARSDTAIRAPSHNGPTDPSSSANSVSSDLSIERQSTEATSTQASTHTRDHRESMGPPVTAGVIKQNQLRPLRLVQNQDAEEEARKKANRQSWMGNWFAKNSVDTN